MSNTFIGNIDFLREPSENKRNARKIYLAAFLAVAVGGLLMAIYAYQHYNQPIGYNNEYQYGIQTVGLGSPSILGTDEIVPISEGGCWGPFDTEQGSIEILDSSNFPIPGVDILPLCTNAWPLEDWHIDVLVVGGYVPCDGFVIVKQKGDCVGKLIITWEPLLSPMKVGQMYTATFSLADGDFLLDSNQYPDVCYPFWICEPYDEIPGKEVDFKFMTFWRGCHDLNQYFTIMSVHEISGSR
ncbi:MAG: hypothetical protein ACFFCW_29835 [Candidatus Hodarchaeota archaeon]